MCQVYPILILHHLLLYSVNKALSKHASHRRQNTNTVKDLIKVWATHVQSDDSSSNCRMQRRHFPPLQKYLPDSTENCSMCYIMCYTIHWLYRCLFWLKSHHGIHLRELIVSDCVLLLSLSEGSWFMTHLWIYFYQKLYFLMLNSSSENSDCV